jgi:hypothetical protein
MAYTLEQYDKLVEAISLGALKVKYGDKEVEYRSLTDMLRIKSKMEIELGLTDAASNRRYAEFNKGL